MDVAPDKNCDSVYLNFDSEYKDVAAITSRCKEEEGKHRWNSLVL